MARRYSGYLTIEVVYEDDDTYRARVTAPKRKPTKQMGGRRIVMHDQPERADSWRGIIRPPRSGFGPGVAYDSPEAYDEVAHAALSFAADEEHELGYDWVSGLAFHDMEG